MVRQIRSPATLDARSGAPAAVGLLRHSGTTSPLRRPFAFDAGLVIDDVSSVDMLQPGPAERG